MSLHRRRSSTLVWHFTKLVCFASIPLTYLYRHKVTTAEQTLQLLAAVASVIIFFRFLTYPRRLEVPNGQLRLNGRVLPPGAELRLSAIEDTPMLTINTRGQTTHIDLETFTDHEALLAALRPLIAAAATPATEGPATGLQRLKGIHRPSFFSIHLVPRLLIVVFAGLSYLAYREDPTSLQTQKALWIIPSALLGLQLFGRPRQGRTVSFDGENFHIRSFLPWLRATVALSEVAFIEEITGKDKGLAQWTIGYRITDARGKLLFMLNHCRGQARLAGELKKIYPPLPAES